MLSLFKLEYICRHLRISKYWFNGINTENSIVRTLYKISFEGCHNWNKNWDFYVKVLIILKHYLPYND